MNRVGLIFIFLMMGTTMAAVVTGCKTTAMQTSEPEQVELEDLPKVSDLLERFGPEQPTEDALPEPVVEPQAIYAVERIILPLDEPLNPAWAMVNESILDEPKRQVLRQNGIRIGTIPISALSDFDQAISHRAVTTRFQTAGSPRMEALVRRPLKQQRALVELTMPPDIPQSYEMAGGAVQLMHQAITNPDGTPSLRLLPHHHRITPTVRVRSHLDTRYDGRMFHEMMMTLTPEPDELLVIGLYWPWQEQWVTIEPESEVESESPIESESDVDSETDGPIEEESKALEVAALVEDDESVSTLGDQPGGNRVVQINRESDAWTWPWDESSRLQVTRRRPGVLSLVDRIKRGNATEPGEASPSETDEAMPSRSAADFVPVEPPRKQLVYTEPSGLPPSIGTALFTGEQAGRPVQVLMVLRVVPLNRPKPDAQ